MKQKLPPEDYIKQTSEKAIITLRVSPSLKQQVEDTAQKYDTSVNRLGEAALKMYLDHLK